jgi:hypothetical protein
MATANYFHSYNMKPSSPGVPAEGGTMRRIALIFAILGASVTLANRLDSVGIVPAYAKNAASETTAEPMLPADAQRVLRSLIPTGKKFVTINAYVAGTNIKDVDLGVSCSSNSSGSIDESVDDNGNVQGKTQSSGSSDCRERHNYYDTVMLGLPDRHDLKNTAYFVTTQCVVKWIWDHCDMPTEHTTYPNVLEGNKKGTFDIYAATEQRLGGKTKACKVCGPECGTHSSQRDGSSVSNLALNTSTPSDPFRESTENRWAKC